MSVIAITTTIMSVTITMFKINDDRQRPRQQCSPSEVYNFATGTYNQICPDLGLQQYDLYRFGVIV